MLVIAHHLVKDPDAFWTAAQNVGSIMPRHLKLHAVYPARDMLTGICLWEGPDVGSVQTFLDENVGNLSRNTCFEVNEAAAFGLPQTSTADSIV